MPAKAKLVTRQATSSSVAADNLGKGSELTFAELDSNLINLRDQTIGIVGDDSSGIDVQSGDTIKFTGTNGVAVTATGSTVTFDASGVSVSSVGDLTAVGSTLSSPSNADLTLDPSGTGNIQLIVGSGQEVQIGDVSGTDYWDFADNTLAWNHASSTGRLQNGATNSGSFELPNDGTLVIRPYSTNPTLFGSATNGATLSSNGAHDIILNTNSGTNSGEIRIIDGANGNITLTPNGTGAIVADGVTIQDNTISSSASNADLELQASGTGLIRIGPGTDGTSAATSNVGVLQVYENLADTPGTREYALGRTMMIKTDGSDSTSGNVRYRIQDTIQLDLNDSALTSSATTRGPQMQHLVEVKDTSSGTSTAGAVTGQGTGIFFPGSGGSGSTINVTNAFSIRSFGLSQAASGETVNVTDYYHFYADAFNDIGSGTTTVTNEYAFYDNGNKLSRFGAVILANQSGDPSGVGDSAHIYAKDVASSSEVFVRDEAGNVTQISPHNDEGDWQFYSRNTKTGKTVRINMEKMIRKLEEFTGETFIETE